MSFVNDRNDASDCVAVRLHLKAEVKIERTFFRWTLTNGYLTSFDTENFFLLYFFITYESITAYL